MLIVVRVGMFAVWCVMVVVRRVLIDGRCVLCDVWCCGVLCGGWWLLVGVGCWLSCGVCCLRFGVC